MAKKKKTLYHHLKKINRLMKKASFILLLLGFLSPISGQHITIMTYNIRRDLASDGENAWPHRKERIIQQLEIIQPDIFGTQEGLPHQIDYINQQLPEYDYIGVPRDDGKTKGEYSNIYFDTSKFSVIENSTFWLSKTPDKPSVGWDSEYPRICTYGLFEEKSTKERIFVFNTHLDHKGEKARRNALKLICKTIKKINPEKHPVALMGDLNLTADSKEIKKLSRQFTDTYYMNPLLYSATFNGFKKKDGSRIDYIFVSKNIDIHRYSILVEKDEKGRFPSDHFPVVSEISLNQESDYHLVWADEFDNDGLPDTTKWRYRTGDGCPELCGFGNQELQWYSDATLKNTRIKSGKLIIEAHKEKEGTKNYTSGRVNTKDQGEWLYGKFEIRAKLPSGLGVWPAIWMLNSDCDSIGWPKCGEIDIVEHVGYMPDSIKSTIHTGAYNHIRQTQKGEYHKLPTCETDFHVYQLEWTPDHLNFVVDGQAFFSFTNEYSGVDTWPFDRPYYLILNLAVGGNLGGKHGVDDSIWPQRLEIDYVRVYQK